MMNDRLIRANTKLLDKNKDLMNQLEEQSNEMQLLLSKFIVTNERLEERDKEIERLENIIKEVREYIENNDIMIVSKEKETKGSIFCCDKELLEILDKENNE